MNFRRLTFATVVAAAALAGCGNLARSRDLGNPNVSAKTLAEQVCSNCHGLSGNAVSPNVPRLAGQMEAYTVAQLNGFKSHNRQDPAGFEYMWGLSRSLSAEQVQGLAAYYAAQTPVAQRAAVDASRQDAGRKIFTTGVADRGVPACQGCHGSEAQGQGTFPRLAGQHADYVVKQLVVFQRTDERPEGAVMKVIAHDLTRQNILDVAGYLQSMPK